MLTVIYRSMIPPFLFLLPPLIPPVPGYHVGQVFAMVLPLVLLRNLFVYTMCAGGRVDTRGREGVGVSTKEVVEDYQMLEVRQ